MVKKFVRVRRVTSTTIESTIPPTLAPRNMEVATDTDQHDKPGVYRPNATSSHYVGGIGYDDIGDPR